MDSWMLPNLSRAAALIAVASLSGPISAAEARRGDSCRDPFKLTIGLTQVTGDKRYFRGGVMPASPGYYVSWGARNGAIMCRVRLYRADGTRWGRPTSRSGRHREYRSGFKAFVMTARRARPSGSRTYIGTKVVEDSVPSIPASLSATTGSSCAKPWKTYFRPRFPYDNDWRPSGDPYHFVLRTARSSLRTFGQPIVVEWFTYRARVCRITYAGRLERWSSTVSRGRRTLKVDPAAPPKYGVGLFVVATRRR